MPIALAAVMVTSLLALYFMPTICAFTSRHPYVGMIFALNLFFGWTLWGWGAAFVWAMAVPPRELRSF